MIKNHLKRAWKTSLFNALESESKMLLVTHIFGILRVFEFHKNLDIYWPILDPFLSSLAFYKF